MFCANNGIPEELNVAAQKYFGEMGVELKWTDLNRETSRVPNITPGVSRRLEKFEFDEISKIIDTSPTYFQQAS